MRIHRHIIASLVLAAITGGGLEAVEISFPVEVSGAERGAGRSVKETFDRFELTHSGDYYRFGTYGDRSRAFRPDRTFFLNNFGINLANTTENGLDYDLKMTTRFVDDRAITHRDDPHITSFQTSFGRKDVWRVRGGDLFPNLSRYSFSRFAKGIQGNYDHDFGAFMLRAAGVVARTERAREGISMRRVARGAAATFESQTRLRNRPRWMLGYRLGSSYDALSSVDNPAAIAGIRDHAIDVHAVVYGVQLPGGWSYSGENAWSRGDTTFLHRSPRHGFAWNSDLFWTRQSRAPRDGIQRLLPIAFQLNWELVDPYFLAPLGIAGPDQFRWNTRAAHRWDENLDWNFGFLRLQDNVRDHREDRRTTTTKATTFSLNSRPFLMIGASPWVGELPPSIREIRAKFDFRHSHRGRSDFGINQKIEDYQYAVMYSNWGINFTGDYHFQITDDDVQPTAERRQGAYGIRMTRPFHWKKWDVRLFPSAGYRVNRDRFRIAGGMSHLQTTTLGIGASWEELSGGVNLLWLDSRRTPTGSDYFQSRLNANLTYKPYLYPNFQMTLSYGYTDLNDQTTPRSYRQTETRLTTSYLF